MPETRRVIVTKPFHGLCGMIVCATKDATDEEILEVCNTENPAGTENGWGVVLREDKLKEHDMPEKCGPVICSDDPERVHYIVLC